MSASRRCAGIARHLSSIPAAREHFDLIVVGGGNAAGYACRELREASFPGRVAVIAEEGEAPYERPALSKAYIHPPEAKVRARLPGFHTCVGIGADRQTPLWYGDHDIDLKFDSVASIDCQTRSLELKSGSSLSWDALILATGARAVTLSDLGVAGDGLAGIHYLRTESDAAELVSQLELERNRALDAKSGAKPRVLVVGGGYIGVESAAALAGWGLNVTMVFPEKHVLERLMPPPISARIEAELSSRGISLRPGVTCTEMHGVDGVLTSAALSDGSTLEASLAVVGVGAFPRDELSEACTQLERDLSVGGFSVDDRFRSNSAPMVFAIGDVAAFPSSCTGGNGEASLRLEHVHHARKSASHAARAVLHALGDGQDPGPYHLIPKFYSRLFEYTEDSFVFEMHGRRTTAAPIYFGGDTKRSFGCYWITDGESDDDKQVVGVLLCQGRNQDAYKEAERIAEETPSLAWAKQTQLGGLLEA